MTPSLYLGKSTENMVLSKLLSEYRETYLPVVDDQGVDLIVRTRRPEERDDAQIYDLSDGRMRTECLSSEFQEVQVKSASTEGLFAAFRCVPRPNYWFVFYVRDIDTMWLIHSSDVYRLSSISAPGTKTAGQCSLSLSYKNGNTHQALDCYIVKDFMKLP